MVGSEITPSRPRPWRLATAIAKSAKHYIFDISEVQESTQKIEDNFRDMMPTAEEFWYDAQPERI